MAKTISAGCICLFLLAVSLVGCGSPAVILHPISQQDIMAVQAGATIEAPKDGYFISTEYMEEVMEAKVSD